MCYHNYCIQHIISDIIIIDTGKESCALGWSPHQDLHLSPFKSRISVRVCVCCVFPWFCGGVKSFSLLLLPGYLPTKRGIQTLNLETCEGLFWPYHQCGYDWVVFSHQRRTQFSTKRVSVRASNSEQVLNLSLTFCWPLDKLITLSGPSANTEPEQSVSLLRTYDSHFDTDGHLI